MTAPSGNNGVYAYGGAGLFPTNSFNSSSYGVDVVFNPANPSRPPQANADSGFAVSENGTLAIAASALLANDTDPNGLPLSITGVINPTHGTVSYNASTQTVTFVPTTGYSGPANFTYSITDTNGASASANVSLTVNAVLQPQANADSGFVVNENGTLSIAASALLANDTDPNGLALSITGVSNPANGTVSYSASTQTVTFVPNTDYSGPANFTYSITDANGGSSSASVGIVVNPTTTSETLFSPSSVPSIVTADDTNAVELGFKFQADTNGQITGIRFYKGPQNTGPHVADLWSSTGTLLATATFSNETASGWQQVNFSNPVAITAGTTYVASYHTNGDYSVDPNYFATSHVSGDLTAPSGNNGVYAYGSAGLFPTNSFNSSSYGVDVVFKPQLAS